MKNRMLKFLSYVAVAALASVLTLATAVPRAEYTKLEQLADLIDSNYIGEADRTQIEDAAAHAMIASLGDRWSYYIPASEYAAHMEEVANAYVGIGVTITAAKDGSGYEITVVNPGSPAEEAGLQVGDVLTEADGISAAGMTTTELRDIVRGKEGTFVSVTVLREGQSLTFSVERREVKTPVATGAMLPGNVGLVKIVNFDSRCAEETLEAIETLLAEGAEKLVFDVRYNGGGFAKEMVKVLDRLLPEGELFRTVDYKGSENVDMSDKNCLEIPMAVLVNASSYSAAEFFAAALREYEAAIVVGEQTSGKGYFQYTYELQDGSAVGLSSGKYFTPKGNSLEGVGITPDVEVSVDEATASAIYYETLAPEEDPQIQAAIQALE